MPWQAPTVTVKWGSYFEPDAEEEHKIVTMVQEAMGGKSGKPIIQLRHALEKVAPIFGIENIESALADLEKEHEEAAQRELDATTAALDAEARAKRAGEGPPAKPAAKSGGSGRTTSG